MHVAAVLGDSSVNLVAEDIGVYASGDLDHFFHGFFRDPGTGRIVRIVERDHLSVFVYQRSEFLDVRQKLILRTQLQDPHLRADRFRDRIMLLVGRHHADHIVLGFDQRRDDLIVRADRAVRRHYVLRLQILIKPGNACQILR